MVLLMILSGVESTGSLTSSALHRHKIESLCAECSKRSSARSFLFDAARSPFTSYSCTGGSQAFDKPWHVFTHNYNEPSWLGFRMCLVRDVCVVAGEVVFYVDPAVEAGLPAPLRLSSLVKAGFLYRDPYEATVGKALVPRLVMGPRPSHLPYAPAGRLYIATALNNAQNYAHLLLDTILPAFSTADFYGLGVEDVQHYSFTSCDTFPNANWVSKSSGKSFGAACWENFERWYAWAMPHAFLEAAAGTSEGVCFGAMTLGQDAMFSSAIFGGHMERARAARALRLRAVAYAQEEGGGRRALPVLRLPRRGSRYCGTQYSCWSSSIPPLLPPFQTFVVS